MKRRGIRWHLLQVQLFGIIPIGLFAAALLYLHWSVQEHERERSQIESVRLLAAAVDNSLDSTIERLSILARLWSSDSLSDREVYAQVREAARTNVDWSQVAAFTADGRGLFRSDLPFGGDVPASLPFETWRPVIAERRAVVSDVFLDSRRIPAIAVGVPVFHGDVVLHVLVAKLDLRWYDRLLNRPGQPEGAVAGLFDRNFKFVARSVEGDARRGGDPTRALVDDMKTEHEGIGRYVNLNGTAVYTSWTFTRHGWGVGFATPSAAVDHAFCHHLLLFGFLWAAAVGAGTVYAFSKARPIAASLESLEDRAKHLATGRRIARSPDSRVEEVHRAVAALERASELLQTAMGERDRSLETEREARAAAEAANRAKDEFLAMLGHELRNPLAAISNAVPILKSGASDGKRLGFAAGVIERQSRHLKRLIDDLLDVGRVMTGKISLARVPVDLAASARHVVASLDTAGRLAERHVDVDVEPVWIEGDATRIEQILTNLLANAATYTAPGGHIRVCVRRDRGEAVIQVDDDGRGIPPENLPHVFDLFFQGDSTADRSGGGLGIGLTLVRRLARLHGGEATVESAGRGRGTTFTVRLPALAAPDPARSSASPGGRRPAETILLVEDNSDARESLGVALELEGHHVLQAGDAASALDLVRRERPGVAVLDIGLPGMDGYELARRVRAELGRAVVLVAVTGYGGARDEEKAARAGFDRHLTKPVAVGELMRALAQVKHTQPGTSTA